MTITPKLTQKLIKDGFDRYGARLNRSQSHLCRNASFWLDEHIGVDFGEQRNYKLQKGRVVPTGSATYDAVMYVYDSPDQPPSEVIRFSKTDTLKGLLDAVVSRQHDLVR